MKQYILDQTNTLINNDCAAVGWKMTRQSTSQPKQEEHTPSADTTPV